MASVKYKYLFYIDDIQVYPVFGKGSSIKYEKEGEYVFKRIKLNGTFTLVNGKRKDFNLVWAKDLDHEFTFRMDYIVDGIVKESVNATFYKTDCTNWDEDNERVDVVLTTIDKYEKVMKALDKEFDLVKDLQPEKYKVKYKKEPLIQIAFPYHSILYNRIGSSSFHTELPDVYSSAQLEDFGFIHESPVRVYIPGTNDMIPDVSGIYEQTAPTHFERLDGVYRISRVEITRWTISEISSGTIVYRGTDGTSPMLDRNPFTVPDDLLLESTVDPGVSYCAPFPIWAHQRILTDATTVGGDATIALPQPDIGDLTFQYDNYIDMSGLVNYYIDVDPSDEHTLNPTKFGKYNEDAQHFANEYFDPPREIGVGTIAYPLMQPSWTEFALVEYVVAGFNDELIEAATTLTLRDAYALADVIQLVFREVDSDINFEGSLFWSRFLFADTNPVSGDPKVTHFITPKSNILTPDYSQPDTGEKITIGRLNELMEAAQMMWWIDNNYNLRIEHISYFKNGRSYDDPYIGVDLTTMYEPRTGKPWAYHTNKYRYRKEEMPEEYVCKWQDECSEYFNGFPIKMISGFVEKGNIKTLNVSYFSSDISLAMAFPENFSTEGYFVMAADYVGGEWEVPYEAFDVGSFTNVLIQNGWWSFYYLHDKFWRHNLPCQDVIINNIQTTATTTKRGKEQKLVFPAQVHPDEMRLIKSGIGNCEIDGMEINLETRRVEITALGDNDFDNPCPTC